MNVQTEEYKERGDYHKNWTQTGLAIQPI